MTCLLWMLWYSNDICVGWTPDCFVHILVFYCKLWWILQQCSIWMYVALLLWCIFLFCCYILHYTTIRTFAWWKLSMRSQYIKTFSTCLSHLSWKTYEVTCKNHRKWYCLWRSLNERSISVYNVVGFAFFSTFCSVTMCTCSFISCTCTSGLRCQG